MLINIVRKKCMLLHAVSCYNNTSKGKLVVACPFPLLPGNLIIYLPRGFGNPATLLRMQWQGMFPEIIVCLYYGVPGTSSIQGHVLCLC
jgi:hypothetical protein